MKKAINYLNDNEAVIDMSKPARHMPEDKVYLAEQTLTDGSKVYAVLIDRVRFDCIDLDQATLLFKLISKDISDFTIY